MNKNEILYGDNLEVIKEIPEEYIDLIYVDPPFFSQKIWKKNGVYFSDKFKNIYEYVEWMSKRLKEMHRVLKPTGTIYLHCDHHASHYLKVEMDKIFGIKNFRSEIIWQRYNNACGRRSKKIFPNTYDNIFVYTKTDKYKYNPELSSIWTDIGRLSRPNYPTQKPEALLKRIILASSNEGDIVLDPFVGGGTTGKVAIENKRNFIGIDISKSAVELSAEYIGTIP